MSSKITLKNNIRKEWDDKYNKSKKGLLSNVIRSQRGNSKRRGHAAPTYSTKELRDWAYSQELFHTLYDNWKRLDYQSMYKPSIDRIDDSIGYTMSNIQLMSWEENHKKSRRDLKSTKLKGRSKSVNQISLDTGEVLSSFKSISLASRETGINLTTINNVLSGKYSHAGGYYWEYKGDDNVK